MLIIGGNVFLAAGRSFSSLMGKKNYKQKRLVDPIESMASRNNHFIEFLMESQDASDNQIRIFSLKMFKIQTFQTLNLQKKIYQNNRPL